MSKYLNSYEEKVIEQNKMMQFNCLLTLVLNFFLSPPNVIFSMLIL